jgi:hypothetical protein
MTLRVRNAVDHAAVLESGDSATTFSFRVTREDGELVWDRLDQLGFALTVLKWKTLAPGEELRFSDSWNLRDMGGALVKPGNYVVQAVLNTKEEEGLTTSRQILVVDGR